MREIEYSKISRDRLRQIRTELTEEYGEEFSRKSVGTMIEAIKRLAHFSESGVRIADRFAIETEYYYLYVNHNYFIYRIENNKVIVVQVFNEKEDFIRVLFGVSGRTRESIEYWGE